MMGVHKEQVKKMTADFAEETAARLLFEIEYDFLKMAFNFCIL
jgi:hypothetical protein